MNTDLDELTAAIECSGLLNERGDAKNLAALILEDGWISREEADAFVHQRVLNIFAPIKSLVSECADRLRCLQERPFNEYDLDEDELTVIRRREYATGIGEAILRAVDTSMKPFSSDMHLRRQRTATLNNLSFHLDYSQNLVETALKKRGIIRYFEAKAKENLGCKTKKI